MIQKTVIITGYSCNNYCEFCYNNHRRGLPERTTAELRAEIRSAKERGSTYLEIIGGEQTIRPDILEVVAFAKEQGFPEIVMATNGRMCAYPAFAKGLVKAGVTELIFSIHGHTAALHDALTKVPGSFAQLKQGIANITKAGGCRLASNTAIVKANYRFLPQIGKFIYRQGIRNAEFISVDPTRGGPYEHFNALVPRIRAIAPYVRECLRWGRVQPSVRHWHIRYVPLCYFQGFESQVSELYERTHFHAEHRGPDFVNTDAIASRATVGRIKPKKCAGCAAYDRCEGIWREYYRHYGDAELKPILSHTG